ncbi:hypothetical protein EB809_02095 [Marinobacter sp. R17]|uniref:hypothetical protein n=1 Tax=Marinobacter sp. R17 TaxID=2484250 RepID=UPI000F4B37B0|nr:hypothetical protein [Marinobacter sp. R17]ROU01695.1 hypothetical protein EB809_02095 [Marinobacter sp. R17]
MDNHISPQAAPGKLEGLLAKLDEATNQLAGTRAFAKPGKVPVVFDLVRRVLLQPGGCAAVEERAQALEEAGVFEGTDWAHPHILVPSLTPQSLKSPVADTLAVEALSELRLLAVAMGRYRHPQVSSEQAHHFLAQVLAMNLALLFGAPGEAEREQQGRLAGLSRALVRHLADRIGYEHVIDQLIAEIWRIIEQRPILTGPVKQMITQIAICNSNPDIDLGASGQGAHRLVSSLFGPTEACREDPGLSVYEERLAAMDQRRLQAEAMGCARAMHDTGLVSAYHAVLVRFLLDQGDQLLSEALGLSSTGRDCLLCYRELVHALIQESVHPETSQTVYGLALMLERGILYNPAMGPALWRQVNLPLSRTTREQLALVFGESASPRARLLEGVICVLGQPLGVGQGNNPTCQSARAISMWSYSDPDYLLQLLVWAARDDEIIMHFEGKPVSSVASAGGVAKELHLDLDAVSLILVPHLDRIYGEMGRLCDDRDGDPHRWINPEFHGWWCGRGFRINVDVATGHLHDEDTFLRHFYASYHPYYNGNQPLIHPQPAGIAVTDSAARFIGWHAISILRVGLDPEDVMRVYFFNPNNDSAQDWGDGIKVSISGHDERHGESSLPFGEFASRLYIFHYDPLEHGALANVRPEELQDVMDRVHRSWGADRLPAAELQAGQGVDAPDGGD